MPAFVKAKFAAVWKAAQVELQGEYSSQRVQDLFKYIDEASNLRVFLAQLLTPLPCLVITAIVDLLPLRSVADGIDSNKLFFVRAFTSFWLANTTTYNQFKHIVPQLPLSNTNIAVYGAVVATITVTAMYGLILAVGFPLPFSIITMSPIWLSLFLLPMAPWMVKSRTNPTAWPLVVTSLKVMVCQEILVVVYPTYFYIFTTIPESGKTYFALLLPLLKLVFRNAMAKTVGYLSDEVPEGVILNVEVVSALFVAYCMQNTPSLKTTIILMVVDALQISASLYDIDIIIRRMKALRKRTNLRTRKEGQSPSSISLKIYSLDIQFLARFLLDHRLFFSQNPCKCCPQAFGRLITMKTMINNCLSLHLLPANLEVDRRIMTSPLLLAQTSRFGMYRN